MCGFCLLTNIEGDVSGFNNPEPKAMVLELPLCENKRKKKLHASFTSFQTLHTKMTTDLT